MSQQEEKTKQKKRDMNDSPYAQPMSAKSKKSAEKPIIAARERGKLINFLRLRPTPTTRAYNISQTLCPDKFCIQTKTVDLKQEFEEV